MSLLFFPDYACLSLSLQSYGEVFPLNYGHGQIPLKVLNVEFDFDVKFLMYVLSTACCQQMQIH